MGYFFEDVNDVQHTPTETVGGFTRANAPADFDSIFNEACDEVKSAWKVDFQTAFRKNEWLQNKALVATFKNALLGKLQDDVNGLCAVMEDGDAGAVGGLYDGVSMLFDNKVNQYITESANVGDLMPIKTVDFPVLVKSHIKESFGQIVGTEVSPSLLVKKHIEHLIAYDRNNPEKTWEYPQCMYDETFKQLMAAGKGTPLKADVVKLPIYQYNLIKDHMDMDDADATNARVVIDLKIEEIVLKDNDGAGTAEGETIRLNTPMQVDLGTGGWLGGIIDMKYTKADGKTVIHVQDILSGMVDWQTNTVTITSSNPSTKIYGVKFSGRLSNDGNQNAIRVRYKRETRDWTIGEGCKVEASYTLEELQEHNAIANVDLYQKSYNDLVMLLHAMSDRDGYDFLDDQYKLYKGTKMNPLDWNPMVIDTTFNLDATNRTVALQSEYIAKELKFKVDRFLVDIADTLKQENIFFVVYGNPRFVGFLNPFIKWVFNAGQSVGGVKLDHSYGVMTSGDVKLYVVSSKLVDAKTHTGLRIIPFWSDGITFKRLKFSTDIVTEKNSGYKDPTRAGGSQTYVWGTERYKDISLQAIQGNINFTSYEDLIELGLEPKKTTTSGSTTTTPPA